MLKKVKTKMLLGMVCGIAAATIVFSCASGCSITYVVHAGVGQYKIMKARQTVESVMADPNTPDDIKRKLEIIAEAKKYAEEEIGLKHTEAYTTYAKLDRPVANWNLMAAPPLEMRPITWWFPIVGKMPYLGYFDLDKGRKKEAQLKAKGYDTYLRGASAYSTLGWFADPIFSPLLNYDIPNLANTIVHEMTHTTIFIEGHVSYNEGLALFVGNRGGLDFLSKKYGPDSEEVKSAKADNHNAVVFSGFLRNLKEELKNLYATNLSDEEKLKEKERIFNKAREDFKKLPFDGPAYQSFLERELNNASVLSRAIYYVDLEMYENLYKSLGSDLRKTVEFFKEIETKKVEDPEAYTKEYIRAHPAPDAAR